MRAIGRLVLRDLRAATSNVMAGVVLFGLAVIPSLFTWFNVIASWDPFANMKNLQVAVASVDEGYQSALVPLRVNVGEKVLAALRANEEIDWVVTSQDRAIDGTKSGEYYAAIVLPESFSADMLTFYADGGKRATIDYYANAEKNALGPTLTGQGVEGVAAQITEVFTQTVGDIALGLVSNLSDFVEEGSTQAVLAKLEAQIGSAATKLRSGATTAEMFSTIFASTIPLVESTHALVTAAGASFDDVSHAVGGGAQAAGDLGSTLSTAAGSLADSLTSTVDAFSAVANRVDDVFAQGDALSGDAATTLGTLAAAVGQQADAYEALRARLADEVAPLLPPSAQGALDVVIDGLADAVARQQRVQAQLEKAAEQITSDNAQAQDSHQAISEAIDAAKAAIQRAKESYETDLAPKLARLGDTLATIKGDVSTIGGRLTDAAGQLQGAAGGISAKLADAQETTQQISDGLASAAATFETLASEIGDAGETGDLSKLSSIIGTDPELLATSLASPVGVERIAVFPVKTFGVAMVALYTPLGLWVGALIMMVAIRVDVRRDLLPGAPRLTTTQSYLGRYGIFGLIGLAQSTLVTLGLILFLDIDPVHPFLLVLAGWVTSLVFTFIMYTLVAALGNSGKAVGVFLLVIQISGAGGAYPLQVLPQWFQGISPFLPATHAVNAIRSAIAGVYAGDFWISLGLLLAFLLPMLLLGLVLRRPLIGFNAKLVEAVESTKLM